MEKIIRHKRSIAAIFNLIIGVILASAVYLQIRENGSLAVVNLGLSCEEKKCVVYNTENSEIKYAFGSGLTKPSKLPVPQPVERSQGSIAGTSLTNYMQIEAWIYPGPPACTAVSELKVRKVHTVKVEYLSLTDSGHLSTLTESNYGCNGYSASNAAILKAYSKEQYVTISGERSGMSRMVSNSALMNSFVNQVVSFIVKNGMTGVDIDFEQFSSWTQSDYTGFKKMITSLGTELHKKGKKLQIDLPAIPDSSTQSHYRLKYEDFNSLPVDQYTIMAYDYQYDYGAGSAIQPTKWLGSVIDYAKKKFKVPSKISIGIPAYGYSGVCNSGNISILTYSQLKNLSGFSSAKRDPASYEMKWKSGSTCYSFSDSTSLNRKLDVIRSKGIYQVSVWHLGGNLWFTN